MGDKDLYLTDKQYLEILDMIEAKINQGVTYTVYDSTEPGNKYTESSIGLCNDKDFCKKSNAMWPEDFPRRRSIKYTQYHHYCPFDYRIFTENSLEHDINGCYYTCILRKYKRPPKRSRHRNTFVEMTDALALELIKLARERLKLYRAKDLSGLIALLNAIKVGGENDRHGSDKQNGESSDNS